MAERASSVFSVVFSEPTRAPPCFTPATKAHKIKTNSARYCFIMYSAITRLYLTQIESTSREGIANEQKLQRGGETEEGIKNFFVVGGMWVE